MTFCACREQFGLTSTPVYKLANQRPKFCVQTTPPHISRDDLIAACLEAFGRWSAVCDVIFAPTDDANAAQFTVNTHTFDGPSGILADCELPSPGLAQQAMRIDPSEQWVVSDNPPMGALDLLAVLCHEIGHGIGLQHFDPNTPPPELMNPIYNPRIVKPQAGEIAFVQKLYGLPQTQPAPSPVPPVGDSLGVALIITQGNVKYRATGKANRVS